MRRPIHVVGVLPGPLLIVNVAGWEQLHGAAVEGLLEGGQVSERLEGRAGLSFRLGNAIELALPVVASPNHRADLAALRFERDQALLEPLIFLLARQARIPGFEVRQVAANRLFRE